MSRLVVSPTLSVDMLASLNRPIVEAFDAKKTEQSSITLNQGKSLDQVIVAVRPGNATKGAKHKIQVELNPESSRWLPVPKNKPSWGQIGPYEATSIGREGNIVTLEIEIPSDATIGVWLDCHVEFEPPRKGRPPIVFKKNDVFRVVE